MIEHLEIFIKNQESRTETIDGIMMIEDPPQTTTQQNLAEFINIDNMRIVHQPHLTPCANVAQMSTEGTSRMYEEHHREPHQEPTTIVFEDDSVPEEEEHFADISSLPSCSPPPHASEDDEVEKIEVLVVAKPATDPSHSRNETNEPMNLATKSPRKITASKNKSYFCKQCNRKFESQPALKYHETSHEMRKVKCEYCDKMFLTRSTLAIHLRIHLEKRPYSCANCDQTFRQKTDLNYHIQSKHTSVEDYRFKCDYCDKKFARKYSLNLHTKLHTGEKNYQCELCKKSFRASSYLQVHLRSHTGEKPYACPLCKKRFTVKADVRRHIGQVHRETPKKSKNNSSAPATAAVKCAEGPSQSKKKANC